MNREIEFRGKFNGASAHWVYGSLLNKEGSLFIINKHAVSGGFYHESYSIIKGTEGQYTGKKDKNGEKIYEGNIIERSDGFKGVVFFLDGTYRIDDGSEIKLLYSPDERISLKIIGNISDNPEYLK